MSVVFTAATEGSTGNFDYNVYRMSDVTGGELVQLTHRTGMIDGLVVQNDGRIVIRVNGKDEVVETKAEGSAGK
jgi:hypothetical protein